MTEFTHRHEQALYERVAQIIEAARADVSRTVNTAMVHAYWLIGRATPRSGACSTSP